MKKEIIAGKDEQVPVSKLPLVSFYLGLAGILSLFLSVAIAVAVEMVGAVSLFRGLVLPLSAAAVVVGLIARNRVAENDRHGRQKAVLGIIFGGVTFGLVILVMVVAMILFLPMLFVGR